MSAHFDDYLDTSSGGADRLYSKVFEPKRYQQHYSEPPFLYCQENCVQITQTI